MIMLKATEDPGVIPAERERPLELSDTQSERDFRAIPIDKVGIRGVKYPIEVTDKGGGRQSTTATIAMFVNLPKEVKGTHMSRFLEVMQAHGRTISAAELPTLLGAVRKRLKAGSAYLDIEFPFFLTKKGPVSGKEGTMNYRVRFKARLQEDEWDLVQEIQAGVTTLCPCSKTISLYGAHNQRGTVTLQVRREPPFWIEDLIRIAESSGSSELYPVLKRPDEKALTEQAYENPVFVEDLVRNVAVQLDRYSDVQWYRIEAENWESIHQHNAYALIERPEGWHRDLT